ncbi:MAG: CidA/LrgA family protein [Tissierellia bacterium]|nr:CidA/LrgA family protein [Tissierellia bacterium]
MKALKGFFVISLCLMVGVWLQSKIPFPIPEAVYGMIIFFILLRLQWVQVKEMEKAGLGLLEYLAFFFVPAGVNIMTEFDNIKSHSVKIVSVILLSMVITLVVTGRTVQWLQRRNK